MVARVSTREDSVSVTLRDLASPLFRCKRVLITTFLLVFAVVASFGLLRWHKYESRMAKHATVHQSPGSQAVGQSLNEADLDRDAKADEQNYLRYLSQREQERLSNALDPTRTETPAISVLPAHSLASIFLFALALAALVSFPTAYIINYFDPFFHTSAEVVDLLGIPVVVAVPKWTA